MDLCLVVYNLMRACDAVVRIMHHQFALRLRRSKEGEVDSPSFLLCIPQFTGHPLTIVVKSPSEILVGPGPNRLHIYPSPWVQVRDDLRSNRRRGNEEEEQETFRVPFLKIQNETGEPIILCEALLDMAFWLPPGEEVMFDCISREYEPDFTFTDKYQGYPMMSVADYATLQVSGGYFPKVKSWGTPPGLELWETNQ